MKNIIAFLFFCSVASAQLSIPTGAEMWETTVRLDTLATDSAFVLAIPRGSVVLRVYVVEDSASGDAATFALGIRGEGGTPRFIDEASYSLTMDKIAALVVDFGGSPYISTQDCQMWLYSGLTTGQVRVIVEYRRLR